MRWCFLFWLAAGGLAVALEPPPPYFEDAAQDSQGIVWAYSRNQHNQIYSFNGSQWEVHAAPFQGNRDAMPANVVKMADGAVACTWRFEDHSVGVTRHLGHESTVLGICAEKITGTGMNVTPLVDSQNLLWITGNFPEIYRTDGKGGLSLVHEITPDELRNPDAAHAGYNNVEAVEDGHGHVWVWSNGMSLQAASLSHVMILTGDKIDPRDPLPQYKGVDIRTIARADDRHLWIAMYGSGLAKIDIDTFDIERVTDPAPGAFSRVCEIFNDSGDTYVVTYLPDFQTSLWRLRNGQWTEVIHQFDVSSTDWRPRSWLSLKEGLIAGSYGNGGAWFIPKQGSPALYSWRSGFPFQSLRAIFRFADGTFFGIYHNSQLFHGILPLPPHDQNDSRVIKIESEHGWAVDTTGHVWMLLSNDAGITLNRWDGDKWEPHVLPQEVKKYDARVLGDAEGRIWVFNGYQNAATEVFDTGSGQFQNFANLQAAYLAMVKNPPHFSANDLWVFDPQFNGTRIAFRDGVIDLDYYDGTSWQNLRRPQITGQPDSDMAVGPPWFGSDGKLHVNIRNKTTWRMDEPGKWSKVAFESHFPADIWSEDQNQRGRPSPPDGCVTQHPDSIARDNLGTYWLSWQGDLYRCIPGQCVKVFAPGEANPFREIHDLRTAFVNAQGNAFLLTAATRMGVYIIKPKSPAPITHIVMQRLKADSFEAQLDAQTKLPVTFRWQLDDEEWKISKTALLNLDYLPNGTHLLKVTGIDDQLNMDATPATAKFEVHVDTARQMTALINQLFDTDFSKRGIAVEALARQPAAALPVLRKARKTATEDQGWWIEASIQESERHLSHQATPP